MFLHTLEKGHKPYAGEMKMNSEHNNFWKQFFTFKH